MRVLDGERSLVRIFAGEADRWEHWPPALRLAQRLRAEGFAGATVIHGVAGFGASSVIHTASLVELSADLPVLIEIVEDEAHVERLLPILDECDRWRARDRRYSACACSSTPRQPRPTAPDRVAREPPRRRMASRQHASCPAMSRRGGSRPFATGHLRRTWSMISALRQRTAAKGQCERGGDHDCRDAKGDPSPCCNSMWVRRRDVARAGSRREHRTHHGGAGGQSEIARQTEHTGGHPPAILADANHQNGIVGCLEHRIAGGHPRDRNDVSPHAEPARRHPHDGRPSREADEASDGHALAPEAIDHASGRHAGQRSDEWTGRQCEPEQTRRSSQAHQRDKRDRLRGLSSRRPTPGRSSRDSHSAWYRGTSPRRSAATRFSPPRG